MAQYTHCRAGILSKQRGSEHVLSRCCSWDRQAVGRDVHRRASMHLLMVTAGSLCLQGNCSVTSSRPNANVCSQSASVAPVGSSVLFTCGLTVVGGNITCMADAQSSANVGYATAPRSNSGLTANSVITELGTASNVAANFNNGVVSVGNAISDGTSTAVNGASSVANEVSTVCICLCG